MHIKASEYSNITDQKTDLNISRIGSIPVGANFYYLDNTILKPSGFPYNLEPILHSGRVMTFIYTPFINLSDVKLDRIPYDDSHYGALQGNGTGAEPMPKAYVYKLNEKNNVSIDKKLGAFNKYRGIERSSKKSWRNESKLLQYPYSYITIDDYINNPLQLEPHKIATANEFEVRVRTALSFNCTYTIYAPMYKTSLGGGATRGVLDGMVGTSPMELPTGSSMYSQFMSMSKHSGQVQYDRALNNSNISYKKTGSNLVGNIAGFVGDVVGGGLIGGAVGGGVPGAIIGAGAGLIKGGSRVFNSVADGEKATVDKRLFIEESQAKWNDLMSAPRNVKLGNGDALFNLSNSEKKVDATRWHIQEEYLNKLADYFTLYGYKQNKLMPVNTKSRKYFNYVKTINVNIQGNKIPKGALQELKRIYDNGITFWHTEDLLENGIGMYDYHLDNTERN